MKDGPSSYLCSYLAYFDEWLKDDAVVELAVNCDGALWIERAGDTHMSRVDGRYIAPDQIQELSQAIVGEAGARLSRKKPLVSAKVESSGRPVRVQVVGQPAVEGGSSLTVRLFSSAGVANYEPSFLFGKPVSLDAKRRQQMLEVRSSAEKDLPGALEQLVRMRLNILVSGGTSTGKTTFARYLVGLMDPAERLVTIEDAFELFPQQPNTVALLSERDPDSARTASRLLEACLRMRPDRIILGELRGREAFTYLEAIKTGHGGTVSTIHAETAETAIDRLAMMVMQNETPLTFSEIKTYVARSIDVIVQFGRAEGRRGITEFYFPGEGETARTETPEGGAGDALPWQ